VTHCAPAEGDVKLSAYPAGELLAFVSGAWGTVCRLGFDDSAMVAASVACRQLGYTRATYMYSYMGAPHMAQSVRGVRCAGVEGRLVGCAPASDPQECTHEYGDVGVQCVGESGTPTPSPCGSGHASTIRSRDLLAARGEGPHSFDGRLRYTSGGFVSHGRLQAEGDAALRDTTQADALLRPLVRAAASACCAGLLIALVAAARRRRRRALLF
jgi:hypothetical protein